MICERQEERQGLVETDQTNHREGNLETIGKREEMESKDRAYE